MAIESTFVLMLTLIILSAAIDYGMYYHRQIAMIQSTHLIVRQVSSGYMGINEAIIEGQDSYLRSSGQIATFNVAIDDTHVSVTGTARYEPFVGLLPVPEAHQHFSNIRLIGE
jgi:hypothetical protein